MIYLLEIGYYTFAFENSRGLDTVVRLLDKGLRVKREWKEGASKSTFVKCDENVEVSISTRSDLNITKGKGRASWKPERVVVTPVVIQDEGSFFSPRQITGSKCLQSYQHKAIRQ